MASTARGEVDLLHELARLPQGLASANLGPCCMSTVLAREPRSVCYRCLRPVSVCYCGHVTELQTRTRVLILQHRRERDVPIGTARMVELCLPGAEIRVGVDFESDPVVQAAVASGAYLLYPGPAAMDLAQVPTRDPITLVVVDGTWWQAKNIIKRNPSLCRLAQVRFEPSRPSDYRIRREPEEHCVATIEAIAHVLGTLEHDPERFRTMLQPFRAMVDTQLHFRGQNRGRPAREAARARRALSQPRRLPALLLRRQGDVVSVHGETNAWPVGHPDAHPSEVVHWLAERLATGDRFEAVIAPRGPIAPNTTRNLQIDEARLRAGERWDSFVARWSRFQRPNDFPCVWGRQPVAILGREGIALPDDWLDIRGVAGNYVGRRIGTSRDCLGLLGLCVPGPWAAGRGGARIAMLSAILRNLLQVGRCGVDGDRDISQGPGKVAGTSR